MRLAAGLAPHLLLAALTGAYQQGPQTGFEHDLTVRYWRVWLEKYPLYQPTLESNGKLLWEFMGYNGIE